MKKGRATQSWPRGVWVVTKKGHGDALSAAFWWGDLLKHYRLLIERNPYATEFMHMPSMTLRWKRHT